MRLSISNKYLFLVISLLFSNGFLLSTFSQNRAAEIRNLSEGADIIITGKVTEQKSVWNNSQTMILTNVTIEVDDYLKGYNNNNKIIVTHHGGEIGEIGELYSHTPSFSNDEEVLLFIKKDVKDNSFKVFQGEYGKLTLIKDELTGEKVTTGKIKLNNLKKVIKNYSE